MRKKYKKNLFKKEKNAIKRQLKFIEELKKDKGIGDTVDYKLAEQRTPKP